MHGRITIYRTPSLPQNSIRASFQDHRDYLWFGTEEGVARFDGMEWRHYRIAEGLVSSFVQAIAEDRFGCIWIGTRVGGLSRFDPMHLRRDAWRSFTTDDGLADNDVRAMAVADDDMLWLTTRRSLSRLDPATMRITNFAESAAAEDVSAVLCDHAGRIWAGSRRRGLGCLDPATGRWTSFVLPSSQVTALAADAAGIIWIGTYDTGVLRLDPVSGGVRAIATAEGLHDEKVLSLRFDRAGNLWIGTERGGVTCARIDRGLGVARLASLPGGLTDYMTMSILQDRNGIHWFGSLAGLTCFEPEGMDHAKRWTSFTQDDGLAHNLVTAIAQDSSQRYWFGTYGGGATSLTLRGDDRLWESFDTNCGLPNDIVRVIFEDANGRIWFGTFGGGLARFDPSTRDWRTFTTADGLAGNAVRVIRPGSDGRFWIGTDGGGISIVDPDFDPQKAEPRFTNYTTAHGLPSNRVSSILHDSRGRVLAGTYEGGVAIFDGERWDVLYSKETGLPANDIYCLAEDSAGRLWIGTGGSGLALVDGDQLRHFTVRDGLPNDTIYQVLVESERSIYASTNRGVFRLRLEETRDVIIAFDRTDGLADDECNGGASLRDRDGRFWFGTLGGVSFIDPRDVPERIAPCRVYLTAFFVHDQPMDLDRVDPIEDSQHEFAFRYGAVEFVSPQKVRYRTRLEGFDRDWSKVTDERSIRYTNLRPGRYRFQVQARNWGGEWSDPAEIAFEVVPDRERLAREEALERERIEKRVLETAHAKLQQLAAELREKEMQLELQAREDALTRVFNRRYLDAQLQQEFDRAVRFKRPLTIVMADVDHFKSVNDRFSHAIGDEVLRIAARLMKTSIRSVDTVARYGGEEFAILLPETGREAALIVCEKIRSAIAEYPWHDVHPDLHVTASFGCSDDITSGSPSQMLHHADQKLFEAKRLGRDRVCG